MFDRVVDAFSRIGLVVGSVLLALMMMVTVVDVFLRYAFSAPLPSGAEITQILLSLTVFAGLILVSRDGSHIVVSIFEPALTRIAPRIYRLLYAISNTLGAAFICYVLVLAAQDAFIFEETTEVLEIPLVWILSVLAIFTAFSTVTSIVVFKRGTSGHGTAE